MSARRGNKSARVCKRHDVAATKSNISAKNPTASQMWNPARSTRKTASTLDTPIHGGMTPRVRHILESRWEAVGRPLEGYVWPAPSKSGHMEPSSLKKQHAKALKLSKVRPFVLYSLRHTFLTRLGASGCNVWTLARIAGHSSISISARYVHPSEDTVFAAMSKLGGHNSGHNEERHPDAQSSEKLLGA